MVTATERNLGGGGFSQDIETKLFAFLDRLVDSRHQPKPKGKSSPGTKGKAEKQLFSLTGEVDMQPVELQRQAQRAERIRLSKIYEAGRKLGCSSAFLSKLVESECSLAECFGAIIDDVGARKSKGLGTTILPGRQRHIATGSQVSAPSPDPGSPEAAEFSFKQEWSRDRRLQAEFPNFRHFAAFKRHESHIKILGGRVVKGERVGR